MSRRIRTTAAIAAAALALASVAAAGNPARSPRASVAPISGTRHLVPGETLLSTPGEVEQEFGPPLGTVVVTSAPASQAHGSSRNAPGSDATIHRPFINNAILDIIDGVITGVTTWGVIKLIENGKTVYKFVKKYIFKKNGSSGQLITNAGDGSCMADINQGQADYLGWCGDQSRIYWTYSSEGKLWNPTTGGMNISSSLNDGTQLYTWYPATDWYTWTYEDICGPPDCNTGTFYGIIWLLYNAQDHGISDNAPGSY